MIFNLILIAITNMSSFYWDDHPDVDCRPAHYNYQKDVTTTFRKSFAQTPYIAICINTMDLHQSGQQAMYNKVKSVSKTSLKITTKSWMETGIYEMALRYLASTLRSFVIGYHQQTCIFFQLVSVLSTGSGSRGQFTWITFDKEIDQPKIHVFMTGWKFNNQADYGSGSFYSGITSKGFYIYRYAGYTQQCTWMSNYFIAYSDTYFNKNTKTWIQQSKYVVRNNYGVTISQQYKTMKIPDYQGTQASFFIGNGQFNFESKYNNRIKMSINDDTWVIYYSTWGDTIMNQLVLRWVLFSTRTCNSRQPYVMADQITCTSKCPDGQGPNWQLSCQPCYFKCTKCEGNQYNQCTHCQSTRHISSKECVCDTYKYDTNQATCASCHYTCTTCSNSSNNGCLSCQSSRKRTKSGTSCPCNTGYYDKSSAVCSACHYSCYKCSGTSTSCTECSSNWKRYKNGNTCLCSKRYYDSGQSTCSSCHYSCYTCNGPNSNQCLSCNAEQLRVKSSSTCPCKLGYYENNKVCKACHYTCQGCVGTSTNCTLCDSAQKRQLISNACPCVLGYYHNNKNVCPPCHYSCKDCSAYTTCTSCQASYKRTKSGSTCPCNPGWYDSGSSICPQCHFSCKTCLGSSTSCRSCQSSDKRQFQNNKCPCKIKFWENNTAACPACQYSCKSCVNDKKCSSCDSSLQRVSDSQRVWCACNVRYYQTDQLYCSSCHYSCYTCNGPSSSQCLSCNSRQQRVKSSSTCPCKLGYYENNKVCQACHYTCQGCVGTSTNCTLCDSAQKRQLKSNACPCVLGYYHNNKNVCPPCHYSCKGCSAYTTCTSCQASFKRTISGSTCPCNPGWYDSGSSICPQCHFSCKTCLGSSTSCRSCQSSDKRQFQNNKCPCKIKFWENNTAACPACQYSCKSCVNDKKCSSCDSSLQRVYDSQKVWCACDVRYYQTDQLFCQSCHYSCYTCNGTQSDQCLTCNNNDIRHLDSNNCLCNDGYFDNGQTVCEICYLTCELCFGKANNCTKCVHGAYLIQSELKCAIKCPLKFWESDATRVCQDCQQNCDRCQDQTKCTKCTSPFVHYQKDCFEQCPDKFYDDKGYCQPCQQPCDTCSGINDCKSCTDSFWFDQKDQYCYKCDRTCAKCSGPHPDQCTGCEGNFVLKKDSCLFINCDKGTFLSKINIECVKCPQTCETCNSDTVCTTCNQGSMIVDTMCVVCQQIEGYKKDIDGKCIQICGDGKLFDLECDDGNYIDGDGCTRNCQVQKNWICQNGSANGASICRNIQPVKIKNIKIKKIQSANQLKISGSLSRITPNMTSDDLKKLVNFNIPNVSKDKYTYNVIPKNDGQGGFDIVVDYQSDVQNLNAEVDLSPQAKVFYNIQSIQTNEQTLQGQSFIIDPQEPAMYYPEQIYQTQLKMQQAVTYISFAGLIFVIIATFIGRRMPGVQMMMYMQMVFYSTFLSSSIHPILFVMQSLQPFTLIYKHYHILSFLPFAQSLLPQQPSIDIKYTQLNYKSSFFYNSDNVILVILTIIIIIVIAKLLSKLIKDQRMSEKVNNIVSNQIMIMMVFSTFLPIVFNAVLQWEYSNFSTFLSIANFSSPFILISFFIVFLYMYYRAIKISLDNKEIQCPYGEFFKHLKPDTHSKYYLLITLVFFSLSIVPLIILVNYGIAKNMAFGGFIVTHLILFSFKRPYNSKIKNIKIIIADALLIAITLCSLVFNKDFQISKENQEVAAWISIALSFSVLVVLIFGVIHGYYGSIKSMTRKNKQIIPADFIKQKEIGIHSNLQMEDISEQRVSQNNPQQVSLDFGSKKTLTATKIQIKK